MLSKRDLFYIQRHKQTESGKTEKDIQQKQSSKESWRAGVY